MSFGLGELAGLLCSLLGFGAGLGCLALAIYALADCLMNEPDVGNNKIIWTAVIILVPIVGPCLYVFLRRPQRIKEKEAATNTPPPAIPVNK